MISPPANGLDARQLDSDLFPQDLANDFRRNDLALLSSGQPHLNGRQALLETLKSPLRDAAGNVIGLVGVCREIAANKINR